MPILDSKAISEILPKRLKSEEYSLTCCNSRITIKSLLGLPFENILNFLTVKQALPIRCLDQFYNKELRRSLHHVDLRDFENNQWCKNLLYDFLQSLESVKTIIIHPVASKELDEAEEEFDFWSFNGQVIWWAIKVHSLIRKFSPALEVVKIMQPGMSTWIPLLGECAFPMLTHLELTDDYTRPLRPKLDMIKLCFNGKFSARLRTIDLREFHLQVASEILEQLAKSNLPDLEKLTVGCHLSYSNEVGTAEIEKFVSTLVVILGQEKVLNKLKEINLISIDFKFCSSASFAKLMSCLGKSQSPFLRDITLCHCSFLWPMISDFATHLSHCMTVQRLQLDGLSLPDSDQMVKMSKVVKEIPWAQYQELRLGSFFSKCRTLLRVFVVSLKKQLETTFQDTAQLLTLHLPFNELGDQQAKHLAEVLPNLNSLQSLILDHNQLGNRSLVCIEKASRLCPKLFLISAIQNKYSSSGIISIITQLDLRKQDSPIKFILDKAQSEEAFIHERISYSRMHLEAIEPSMYMHECDPAVILKSKNCHSIRASIVSVR